MHSIKVSAEDFRSGSLPEVCVRSGLLAESRYQVMARNYSGAPVYGSVSLHGSVARKISILRLVGAVAMAAALATSVVGIALDAGFFMVLTAIAMVIATVSLVAASRSGITAKMTADGLVELSPAADAFRLAIMVPPSKCSGCEGGSCGSSASDCADETTGAVHS